jgi:hypothetical protein
MDLTLNNPCWNLMKTPWQKDASEAEKKAA